MATIHAIYEGGVFRPTGKVVLQEGTHVEVFIPQSASTRDPKAVAAKLALIAASTPQRAPESTARDHDRILYGEMDQP